MGTVNVVGGITDTLQVRVWGVQDYVPVWQQMQAFTQNRGENTPDEIWVVQHSPVFTLGRNGKM